MKMYIFAMSEYKKEIYRKLTSASEQINEHIIRLLLFPHCKYENHWKNEIYSFLFRIDRLKGKNKWPSAKFIKEALAVHNDILQNYVLPVIEQESEFTAANIPLSTIEAAINEYQDWLADNLSKSGIVSLADVHTKLDEILKKYQK